MQLREGPLGTDTRAEQKPGLVLSCTRYVHAGLEGTEQGDTRGETRNEARGGGTAAVVGWELLHLRSPSPSPWMDFLMRSSMVVSHWSRREMESNSFTASV